MDLGVQPPATTKMKAKLKRLFDVGIVTETSSTIDKRTSTRPPRQLMMYDVVA